MNLRESCNVYSRKYRQTRDKPLSFKDFNDKFGTSLLEDRSDVHRWFKRIIKIARQQDGVPVRRRLPSLFTKFSQEKKEEEEEEEELDEMDKVKSLDRSLYVPTPSIKNNGRFPQKPKSIAPSSSSSSSEEQPYTLNQFKDDVKRASLSDKRLQHKNNMFVYFYDKQRPDVFASRCVKLNKKHADILRQKNGGQFTSRTGELTPETWKWSKTDVEEITKAAKAKQDGPFFLRLESI